MPTAELGTMFLFVSVIKDTLGIRSQVAIDQQQRPLGQKLLIHAAHHHVVSMLSAGTGEELPPVPVYQACRGILTLNANRSVVSILTVL
jgi:hypothetical protein